MPDARRVPIQVPNCEPQHDIVVFPFCQALADDLQDCVARLQTTDLRWGPAVFVGIFRYWIDHVLEAARLPFQSTPPEGRRFVRGLLNQALDQIEIVCRLHGTPFAESLLALS